MPGAAARRMTLVTADQVLSGASNVLVVIFIAHVLRPADFGRFTLLFLGFSVASVILRSLICSTVLVHPDDADERPGAIIGSTLLFSLAVGVVCCVAGFSLYVTGSTLGSGVLLLGAMLPLLQVQDLGRYLAIATRRPIRALWLDGMWIVLEVAALVYIVARDRATFEGCVLAWLVPGAVSGLWVFVQYGPPRPVDLTISWLRSRWDFSWRSMASSVTTQLSTLVGFSAVAVVSGGVAVGAVRAAILLTRPGNTVVDSVSRSAVADMARDRPDNRAIGGYVNRIAIISVAVALGNLVLLVFMPDAVGRAILGKTWPVTEPLILAAGLQLVFIAARNGTRGALLSRKDIRFIMVSDIIGSLLLIVVSFAGAVVADAQGVMWACALMHALLTLAWWALFPARLARTTPSDAGPRAALPGTSTSESI